MRKGTLAIIEFERFYRRELRIPTCAEFVDLGYCRRTYYNARDQFFEMLKEEDLAANNMAVR